MSIIEFQKRSNELAGNMTLAHVILYNLGTDGVNVVCNHPRDIYHNLPNSPYCTGSGWLQCSDDSGSTNSYGTQYGDCRNFWEELSAAKLISGSYNAISYGTGVIGTDIPAVNYNTNYGIIAVDGSDPTNGTTAIGGGVWLLPGTIYLKTGEWWSGQYFSMDVPIKFNTWMLSPYQAYQLDQKIDDGLPQSGNLRPIKFMGSNESYIANDDNKGWYNNAGGQGINNCVLPSNINVYNVTQITPACIVGYKVY